VKKISPLKKFTSAFMFPMHSNSIKFSSCKCTKDNWEMLICLISSSN
jgi:hypothetical protein